MSSSPKLSYPSTKRGDASDTYWGTTVADPYRWLEDPESPEVQAWVAAQNGVTRAFLADCPKQQPLEQRLKQLYDHERVSCPFRRGEGEQARVFYFRNSGLQNQSVLYVQRSPDAEAQVLLDPNVLEADGTAALGCYAVSKDASYLAYGVARSGSDWQTIHVLRVSDGQQLSERLEWVKFSGVAWTHDSAGFFYSRYPQPAEFAGGDAQETDPTFKRGTETSAVKNHQLWYHRVGTPQADDQLVYATPDHPDWMINAEVAEDGAYLLIGISESCDTKNLVHIARLNPDGSYAPEVAQRVVKLVDRFEAQMAYVNNEGARFYWRTNHSAGRYKLVAFDVQLPADGAAGDELTNAGLDTSRWTEVIPEHAKDVLDSVCIVAGDKLITEYSRDVQAVLSLYSLDGRLLVDSFPMPDVGCVAGLTARKEDSTFFYAFSSFLYPGTIFEVKLNSASSSDGGVSADTRVFRETRVPGFDPTQFSTKQVFYPSKDGTQIPMFIIARRDVKLDSNNPTILYGYGGFNISLPPSFAVSRIAWLQHFNGVYALANIRGGGEYGESWYKAGVLQQKKNCFDDFCAAAEYLAREGYTSPAKLAINGGSNGGLLVCACANARPELFGAVVGQVGVLDMLKFHTWTIGHAWTSDYGSVEQSKDMFDYLYSYSPVHNVPDQPPFPALLITCADHDDRVVPLHSYKYIATAQSKLGGSSQQTAPLLIRIETKGGHGAGLPLSKRIVEQADVLAFLARVLGAEGKF